MCTPANFAASFFTPPLPGYSSYADRAMSMLLSGRIAAPSYNGIAATESYFAVGSFPSRSYTTDIANRPSTSAAQQAPIADSPVVEYKSKRRRLEMISSPRRRRQAKERPGVEVVVAQDDVGVTKEDGLLEGQQEHYQQHGDHASNNLAVEGSDLPPETAQDPDEEIPAAPTIPTNPDLCLHAYPQPRSPVDPPPPPRVDQPTQQQRERIIFNKAELLSLRPVVHAKPIPQDWSKHLAPHHAALLARVDVIAALELD